jgi:hypothetical protein
MTDQQPGTPGDDPAFDRLRKSDPAAGLEPDLNEIRALVEQRLPRSAPGRRVWNWGQVAAAILAVLVIGAGGFALGSINRSPAAELSGGADQNLTSAPSTSTVLSSPAAPRATSPTGRQAEAMTAQNAPPMRYPESASLTTAQADSAAAGDAKSMYPGTFRTTFRDGGLSTERGSAEAWTYDAAQVATAAGAERLAAAFGVSGSATPSYSAWSVGPQDGSGPSVWLSVDGAGSFSYNDPSAYSWAGCSVMDGPSSGMAEPAIEPDIARESAVAVEPSVCESTTPPQPAISEEDAISRAQAIVTALEMDAASFSFKSDSSGDGYRNIVATPSVSVASDSGNQWNFSFWGDQLQGAYGQLAPLVSLGQYAVISPAEAVARLNDNRFGAMGPIYPLDFAWPEPSIEESASMTPPPVPTAGSKLAWPVAEESITQAELITSTQWLPNGSMILAPTYKLSNADGFSWTVIAVVDDQLDFSTS